MDRLECVELEYLRKMFRYDSESGGLFLVEKRKNGKVAPQDRKPNRDGYITIWINGKDQLEHRLVWFYVHGVRPHGIVDHVNRVKSDNRIENLRIVGKSENALNRVNPNRTSGSRLLGVKLSGKKYTAGIVVNGKHHHIGTYDTPEEAHQAYMKRKSELNVFGKEG